MRRMFGVATLAVMAVLTVSAFSLARAAQVSPAEDKSASMRHAPSAYDYLLSSGTKQVRLKMENIGGEKVYSSFVDGVLIANGRIPATSTLSYTDAASFNQYVKTSSDALAEAGLNPKALGLTYISAQAADAAGGDKTVPVSSEALRSNANTEHARMGIAPGMTP